MYLLLGGGGGGHFGVGGDIAVGELGPTPHTRHDDAARRHWVEVPNLRDIFPEVGVELLEERPPPPPNPSCSCFANAGGAEDPWPDLHSGRR